jgi:hypothetical protein
MIGAGPHSLCCAVKCEVQSCIAAKAIAAQIDSARQRTLSNVKRLLLDDCMSIALSFNDQRMTAVIVLRPPIRSLVPHSRLTKRRPICVLSYNESLYSVALLLNRCRKLRPSSLWSALYLDPWRSQFKAKVLSQNAKATYFTPPTV